MSLKHLRGDALLAIRAARISRGDGDKIALRRKAYRKVADALRFECAVKGLGHKSSIARLAVAL